MTLLQTFAQSEPQRLQGFLTLHRGDPEGEMLCVVLFTQTADFPTVPGRWSTTTCQTFPWQKTFPLVHCPWRVTILGSSLRQSGAP